MCHIHHRNIKVIPTTLKFQYPESILINSVSFNFLFLLNFIILNLLINPSGTSEEKCVFIILQSFDVI